MVRSTPTLHEGKWPLPPVFLTFLILSLSVPLSTSSPHHFDHGDDFESTQQHRRDYRRQQQPPKQSWRDTPQGYASQYRDADPPLQDSRRIANNHPLLMFSGNNNHETDDMRYTASRRRAATLTEDEMSWSAKLRHDLLLHYDRGAYPWEYVWSKAGWVPPVQSDNLFNVSANKTGILRTGVPIEVGINYHRVFAVDVTNSVADLVVWFRMSWEDPRLTWNPDDYGGIDRVWFWIGEGSGQGGEMSEIWSPDLELWNLEASLTKTLADAHAVVDSDGGVWWSRPGHLRAVCNFAGLNKFPFDVLSCITEIGSWAYSGLYLRPILMDEGYSIGGSDTAGEAYVEYKLEKINATEHVYPPFPAAPEEDWPVLKHEIFFRRAWHPYVRGYLLLQVILNLAAMACFWLPPHCGERMQVSITALLASVTSDLVVSSRLPSASEMTWLTSFSIVSLAFGALVLFESAMVIYFHYLTVDNLTPYWVTWINKFLRSMKEKMGGRNKKLKNNTKSGGEDDEIKISGSFDDFEENSPSRGNKSSSSCRNNNSVLSSDNQRGADLNQSVTSNVVGRDADDFIDMKELENNLRWQRVACLLDEISRVVFPIGYAIALGVLLGPVEFKEW